MHRLAVAVVGVIALFGAVSCQVGATMWASCSPAADGNPFGTDGTYVLLCEDGIWKPIMTAQEYLRILQGEWVILAPLPKPPTTTTTAKPTTTSTTIDTRCDERDPGADLHDCDLSQEDLSGLDLSGTDFTGANMHRAVLNGADVSAADFTGADLRQAEFIDADLTGADLTDTMLQQADFTNATTTAATTTGATWLSTYCPGGALNVGSNPCF